MADSGSTPPKLLTNSAFGNTRIMVSGCPITAAAPLSRPINRCRRLDLPAHPKWIRST